MSAQRFIDRVHGEGGRVVSFLSICGGLPAPSSNTNPLGYKLSWSPRGVLLASRNTATYLRNGEVVTVGGRALYEPGKGYVKEVVVDESSRAKVGRLELERYPNRDSTVYGGIYGLEEAFTLLRGTYRNAGWCSMMAVLSEFGFTDMDAHKAEETWRRVAQSSQSASAASQPPHHLSLAQFTYSVMTSSDAALPAELAEGGEGGMSEWVGQRIGASFQSTFSAAEQPAVVQSVLSRLQFLGLFSTTATLPSSPLPPTSLDVMCALFERHLQYQPMEEDMCVMQHTFEVEWPTSSSASSSASSSSSSSTTANGGASGGSGGMTPALTAATAANSSVLSSRHEAREQWKCVLVELGAVSGVVGEYSSMARTVSLPVACCIRALLDGRWSGKAELLGVVRPVQPVVYHAVLDEMEQLGVTFHEAVERTHLC